MNFWQSNYIFFGVQQVQLQIVFASIMVACVAISLSGEIFSLRNNRYKGTFFFIADDIALLCCLLLPALHDIRGGMIAYCSYYILNLDGLFLYKPSNHIGTSEIGRSSTSKVMAAFFMVNFFRSTYFLPDWVYLGACFVLGSIVSIGAARENRYILAKLVLVYMVINFPLGFMLFFWRHLHSRYLAIGINALSKFVCILLWEQFQRYTEKVKQQIREARLEDSASEDSCDFK